MPPPFPLQTPSPRHSLLFLLSSLLLIFLLMLLSSFRRSPLPPQHIHSPYSHNAPHRLFLSLSSGANATIASHLRTLTLHPHLAGTTSAAPVAAYVLAHLQAAGLETHFVDYSPLLSYPASASLSLHRADGALLRVFSLSEPADPAGYAVQPYHAYSPSGDVYAPAVYVNYGRQVDYRTLERMGVEVKGCVVIARRGGEYRGAVVARAAEKGAAAVLMFKEADGGGVERGTVLLVGVGDPLTPGWAATDEAERLGMYEEDARQRFPKIPSMPVAEAVATEILRTLGGLRVPHEWRGQLPLEEKGGVGPGPLLVNFTYQEDKKLATIRNVFGIIRGNEEPDRFIILGNHRDAWTYGAVDPNSGTASLLDVARRFGALLKSGWQPRRTIILCSWDAEEFGMIGSTEWVEQNLENLGSKAVAYLNVDCAVQGPGFFTSATPQLDKILIEVTKQINDPDVGRQTVYETWVAMNGGISIQRLARADSDFSAFLHLAGIPSVNMYYGKEFPVYHTALDSYSWMEKYGDPLFHRHVAIVEIWGLLALRLADDLILPFNYISYAEQLQDHVFALRDLLDNWESIQPINASIDVFIAAIGEILDEGKRLQHITNEKDFNASTRMLNDRLMLGERAFLEAGGLKGRLWQKHLLYSPPKNLESSLSFFPGIVDAISQSATLGETERRLKLQHQVWRVARAILRAASALRGELT